MKYLIDSANRIEIDEVIEMGIDGVTANPSMYKKNNEDFYSFIKYYSEKKLTFLSAEVMEDSLEGMLKEVDQILDINKDIVIKINFSKNGLRLAKILHERGIKTAMTLIFTVNQAIAALQCECDYLFPFVGRNDNIGVDGLDFIDSLQAIVDAKGYKTKIVAASIKNLFQLSQIAKMGIDYAAVPYNLYIESLEHPLTKSGYEGFAKDWESKI